MDQVSGFLPQIGWSPLLTPATPKKPPASTVEPAAKSASTSSGYNADVDTQTPQDHAQSARLIAALASVQGEGLAQTEGASIAQSKPPVTIEPQLDPEMPSGPIPTFDVTPLQVVAATAFLPVDTPVETETVAPATAEQAAQQVPQASDPAQLQADLSDLSGASSAPAPSKAEPTPPPAAQAATPPMETAAKTAAGWHQVPAAAEHALDVTR